MKRILFSALVFCCGSAMAQPKIITQATISTTTNVIAPEEEDVTSITTTGGGGGNAMFRNFGDGETKSVTQVKNDLVKTVIKSDMGRSTIIRNNASKLTTTLIEMMGNKTGFYVSDDEQAELRKSMDSMMQARSKDSAGSSQRRPQEPPVVEIVYTEGTKKIAGYDCKKAFVITTRLLGLVKDTAVVWYSPEFKIKNVSSVGGGFTMAFGGGAATATNSMEKIDGFVMGYETKMRRNRTMIVTVTKVDLAKEIADKEFEIPKDFDVKPMKEMRNMMSGAGGNQIQIRRGD
ncbi:MAG: hypothetical protein H7X88_09705 [Gloeobacteraceae cyanobacterium ES-bin-316]|nr:hypothetical protein [Ferruginibacter sp.]